MPKNDTIFLLKIINIERIGAKKMAIEITIIQKGSARKALPFEVITGDELKFGRMDGTLLLEDTLGDDGFIAYNPNHIARGFSVQWKEGETYKVVLRLTFPSHDEEIDDFYDAVTRIATYWKNCKIVLHGRKVLGLNDLVQQRSDMKAESLQALSDLCNKTKFDKAGNLVTDAVDNEEVELLEGEVVLQCVKWPLYVGGKEKAMVADETDSTKLKDFLHEKLSIDAYYARAFFYQHPDTKECHAKYGIDEGNLSIFPLDPVAPTWLVDKTTGKQVEVANWEVVLFSTTKDEMLGEIPYADFIAKLKNKQYYDHRNVLIQGVTLAEMEEMLEAGTAVVQ